MPVALHASRIVAPRWPAASSLSLVSVVSFEGLPAGVKSLPFYGIFCNISLLT